MERKSTAARRRSPRADARRNRAHVLEVAIAAFSAEGLSISLHEIARRARVGTGTVSRHFPTKEALLEAIVRSFAERLVEQAQRLAAEGDSGDAFFAFFRALVEEGAANRGLADAFAGAGYEVEAASSDADQDVMGALHGLLTAAQEAGAVRNDVDTADVKAMVVGCLARERHGRDDAARERLIGLVCDGLRTGHVSTAAGG